MPSSANVLVVTTGGTIASTVDPASGHVTVRSDAGAPWAPAEVGAVTHLSVANQPSTRTTPQQVLDWYAAMARSLAPGDVGAVMTVGTNTLEEVAYLLHLVHAEEWPLVVTGAMRPSDHPASDGPGNVADAVAVVRSPRARSTRALVVMNEHVYRAPGLRKVAGQGVDAFRSPYGILGHVESSHHERVVRWTGNSMPPSPNLEPRLDSRVEVLPATMGGSGALIRAAVAEGAHGLVVEAFAGGDVTPDQGVAVAEAIEQGVAVVLADSGYARTGTTAYDGVGEGAWLARAGAVRAPGISARQARLLLMLALGQHDLGWAEVVFAATAQ